MPSRGSAFANAASGLQPQPQHHHAPQQGNLEHVINKSALRHSLMRTARLDAAMEAAEEEEDEYSDGSDEVEERRRTSYYRDRGSGREPARGRSKW